MLGSLATVLPHRKFGLLLLLLSVDLILTESVIPQLQCRPDDVATCLCRTA